MSITQGTGARQQPLLGSSSAPSSSTTEVQRRFDGGGEEMAVSSRTGVPLHKTVRALLDNRQGDYAAIERGMAFIRKCLALLFLQYAAVLVILSPFCLIQPFQRAIEPIYIMIPLGAISFFGLAFSIYLVATKGHIKWYARASYISITVFIAVGLGLKLAKWSWANYALIAVAQASTNFGLLLALLTFDSSKLKWLSFNSVLLMFFCVGGFWVLIMREAGSSWLVATTVPLCGWFYALSIAVNIRKATYHREPDDYLRATIFALGPNIPDRFIPKRQTAEQRWNQFRENLLTSAAVAARSAVPATAQQEETKNYGGVEESSSSGLV